MKSLLKNILKKSQCPYCQKELIKIPKKASKCPNCNKIIHVRKGKLMTDWESERIDLIKKIESFGMSKNDFERHQKILFKRFKGRPGDRDVIWSIYHELIQKNVRDYQKLRIIYYDMALFLNEEGKNYFNLLQHSRRMELLEYKNSNYIKNVTISTAGGCKYCEKLKGEKYSIDEAMKIMPIPNKNCNFILNKGIKGFCRCMYLPEIEI